MSSFFVATYDSQGYGGGIRPRLQTRILEAVPFRSNLNCCYQSTAAYALKALVDRLTLSCWEDTQKSLHRSLYFASLDQYSVIKRVY
jgi:hypothetical protein